MSNIQIIRISLEIDHLSRNEKYDKIKKKENIVIKSKVFKSEFKNALLSLSLNGTCLSVVREI